MSHQGVQHAACTWNMQNLGLPSVPSVPSAEWCQVRAGSDAVLPPGPLEHGWVAVPVMETRISTRKLVKLLVKV